MSAAPTKRQLEALHAIYLGRHISDRRERTDFGRHYASSMGGAIWRMRDRMGEAGWLVERTTTMGRTYYDQKLTAAGLIVLAARMPELEGINDRIDEARAREAEAAAEEREEAQRQRAQIREQIAAERIAKIAHFRELMQSYQMRDAAGLTDDQVLAICESIADQEFKR